MILLKIFYFLKGYVIIHIIDNDAARLLNLCSENGIYIWNVNSKRAYVEKRNLAALFALAKSNGIPIEQGKEYSFSSKYLANFAWVGLVGMILIMLFFSTATGYVWKIEVNGCEDEVKTEVLTVLESQGLKIGAKKSALPNGNSLRDSVIYGIDGVNWAWVYLDGTLARVEISYSEPPPIIDDDTSPCNISAANDGIISSVSARAGRTMLNVGDKVSKGDIIISGAMPGGSLTAPYAIRAEGEIYAETVHTKSTVVPLYKTYTRDTGREYRLYSIRLFELEFPLKKNNVPFSEYRLEEKASPVGICSYRYIETESIRAQISKELAEAEAKEAMYEQITKKLAPGSRKLDERITTRRLTEDSIMVTLSMTFNENIGVKTPIELWQTEELTNDKTD